MEDCLPPPSSTQSPFLSSPQISRGPPQLARNLVVSQGLSSPAVSACTYRVCYSTGELRQKRWNPREGSFCSWGMPPHSPRRSVLSRMWCSLNQAFAVVLRSSVHPLSALPSCPVSLLVYTCVISKLSLWQELRSHLWIDFYRLLQAPFEGCTDSAGLGAGSAD